jgi:hypothetical protein
MRHQSNLVPNQGLEYISKQKQNKKNTQTNKEKNKTKRHKNKNKTKIIIHTDFPGYNKCGKNIL